MHAKLLARGLDGGRETHEVGRADLREEVMLDLGHRHMQKGRGEPYMVHFDKGAF
jgi:hypothetical protein